MTRRIHAISSVFGQRLITFFYKPFVIMGRLKTAYIGVLDITFREGELRIRKDHASQNMALIRRLSSIYSSRRHVLKWVLPSKAKWQLEQQVFTQSCLYKKLWYAIALSCIVYWVECQAIWHYNDQKCAIRYCGSVYAPKKIRLLDSRGSWKARHQSLWIVYAQRRTKDDSVEEFFTFGKTLHLI